MKPGALYEWDVKPWFPRPDILKVVLEEFRCDITELRSKSRLLILVDARTIYCHLVKKYSTATTIILGSELDRDHTAISHFWGRMEDRIYSKDPLIERLKTIENKLLTKQL